MIARWVAETDDVDDDDGGRDDDDDDDDDDEGDEDERTRGARIASTISDTECAHSTVASHHIVSFSYEQCS